MYIMPRRRCDANSWERIIPYAWQQIDFDPSELKQGRIVNFTYRPALTFTEREYKCKVVSAGKRSMVCEILQECPVPFRFGTGTPRKRFYLGERMRMYRIISPIIPEQKFAPADSVGEDGLRTATTTGYRDEHGDR
jgi:hypothetical protein